MKTYSLFAALALIVPSYALALENLNPSEMTKRSDHSVELAWKLSEPDTARTSFGLSYGGHFRGFVYLDLQNVPASENSEEKLFDVPGYTLGFTVRDTAAAVGTAASGQFKFRTYSDVFVRYSEASQSLGRDGFWTLGIQPGLNLGASDGVTLNLGFEYNVNLIDSMTSKQQMQLKSAGVVGQTVRPAITFNVPL